MVEINTRRNKACQQKGYQNVIAIAPEPVILILCISAQRLVHMQKFIEISAILEH
jgi:hypothetical protein